MFDVCFSGLFEQRRCTCNQLAPSVPSNTHTSSVNKDMFMFDVVRSPVDIRQQKASKAETF